MFNLLLCDCISSLDAKLSLSGLPMFEQIIPDKCRYDVLSTKIEIRLAKSEPIHWTSFEFSMEVAVPQRINVSSGKLISPCP